MSLGSNTITVTIGGYLYVAPSGDRLLFVRLTWPFKNNTFYARRSQ